MTPEAATKRGWGEALAVYLERPVLSMLFLGFSAGLPFYLVFSTLSAWLRTAHIDRATITMLSWVGLMYSFKFLWAPVVDGMGLPVLDRLLGRRRSWMLLAQLGLAFCLANVALSDPTLSVTHVALFALGVAFFAATQDIAIDAWRIESSSADKQGAMAAAYQIGYRSALMVASAGALVIAGESGFRTSYLVMAALTSVGIVTTLLIHEPHREFARSTLRQEQRVIDWLHTRSHWPTWIQNVGAWLMGSVVGPVLDFFGRYGVGLGLLLFAFIASYRLTDYVSGTMANTFYIDMGYSVTEIGVIAKFFGWPSTLVGAVLGGVIIAKIGHVRALIVGSVLIIVSNIFYGSYGTYACHVPLDCAQNGMFEFWSHRIAARGPATDVGLSFIVGFDNLALGVHGTALVAFMSSLTSAKYTATQYAVLSSLYSLPGKLLMGLSGTMVNALGYGDFYLYAALLSVPGLVMLYFLSRRDIVAARN